MSHHDTYTVNVDREVALQAACTCGWRGPARHLDDQHIWGLIADDLDWHLDHEEVAR